MGGQIFGYLEVLRRMAEDSLTEKAACSTSEALGIESAMGLGDLPENEILKLFHESRVYQIELEMQNEELFRVKEQAEFEAEKYLELYDSSPSGYFTLSREGNIVELNHTGAQMLGKERAKLKNSKFRFFVSPDSISFFNIFVERGFNSHVKESCEIILSINKELPIDVYLTGLVKADGEHFFVTMIDISERKRAERELIAANEKLDFQYNENAKRALELLVANKELLFQNDEKAKRAAELIIANKELLFQNEEKAKLTIELIIANKTITSQSDETEKRAAELIIANKEILIQSEESEKRGFDLLVSNKLIAFQHDRLQKITSLIPGVVFQYRLCPDGSSGFPYCSEAIQSMYKVTPEEIAEDASAFFAKLHPDDLEGFLASIQKSAKDLFLWENEFRVLFDDGSMQYHAIQGLPKPEEDGSVLWHGFIADITEHKRLEDALHESERRHIDVLNEMQDVVWSLSWPEMTLNYISQSVEQVFRRPLQDFIAEPSLWATMVHPDDKQISEQAFDQLIKEGSAVRECRIVRPDGTIAWINDRSKVIFGKNKAIVRIDGVARDITASKQAANYKEIHHEILEILNEPGALHDTIQRLLNTLKIKCGFDAVGIRLQDGDDFPYFAQNGFSADFLFTENTLITQSKEGGLCRDKKGNISLECTCGLVITGKTDPVKSLFTEWGSIWTNDSYPFLSISSDEDPRLHPRNVCIHQGYASVALIPIKNKSRNIGLIQFNDQRKDCFTPDMIDRLEEVAMHIGDVLMRKQAEEELGKSNELLSLFIKHSPIFAFIKEVNSVESRTLKASENYRDMLGISGSEMAGKTMYELFPAELAASITADDWMVASEGKQIEIEEVLNGHIYSTIKFPITLGDKKLLAGYTTDITERRFLEKKLIESERKYRTLIETAQEGILIAQGPNLKFVNHRMTELSGYSGEELLEKPFMDIVYPDDRELVINNYLKRQRGEKVDSTYHFRIFKKGGSLVWIEVCGNVTEWEGQPAVINFGTDITERKQREEEIQQKNAELQILNAEKDKFFSIISHDLRSPFQALLGYFPLTMEIIKTYPLEEVQLRLFGMRTSAEKLYHLVENLLEWSMMQRGLLRFLPSTIRLQVVIAELVTIIRNSADKKMIEIRYDVPENLVVKADKRMVESILNNLIFNAVKFTRKQGRVTISAMAMPENFVEISIKDTGIGMNKELIDSLFLIGEGIGHLGTEREPGSGLGLLICKDFVEKHAGKIWAESEEGQGSTFRFTLPGSSS